MINLINILDLINLNLEGIVDTAPYNKYATTASSWLA